MVFDSKCNKLWKENYSFKILFWEINKEGFNEY
jgi:hypothetical protein